MQITRSSVFADVYVIHSPRFNDERGFFMESFRASWLAELAPGLQFVQDNQSFSQRHVLRGLHYQLERPQGKLVRVVQGCIYDVAVDMRRDSPTFGHWQGFELSAENGLQLWLPPGFAHGFYTLEAALCLYRCTDYYHAPSEHTVHWQDADLAITWPLSGAPLVSAKDQTGVAFAAADYF